MKEKEMLCFEMVGLQDFFTASIKRLLLCFWSIILADLLVPFTVRYFGLNFLSDFFVQFFLADLLVLHHLKYRPQHV